MTSKHGYPDKMLNPAVVIGGRHGRDGEVGFWAGPFDDARKGHGGIHGDSIGWSHADS